MPSQDAVLSPDRHRNGDENGQDEKPHSAVQYVRNQLGMQVCAIAVGRSVALSEQQGGDAGRESIMSACWPTVSGYGVEDKE